VADRDRPRLNVTLDAEVKDEIKDTSDELGVPISRLIEEVLREFIDSYREDPMIGRRLHKQIQERKREDNQEDEPSETVRNILERMDEVD
jgi:antitoxin component of RelBE/YafQ-DinJ toxin-antitoxin module